jgi:copper chaperone CopZ
MKIEVLYFEGCPNHQPAVERIQEVLKEESIPAEVLQIDVQNAAVAREIGFLGSPSIRVNGLDVEPAARSARDYGMMCRTYVVDDRREGLPPREMVRQAIKDAGGSVGLVKDSKTAPVLVAGSVFAAMLASFCCVLPIVFALTGVSILGASAIFAAWRPYLLGATFGLLALGFYFAYRPGKRRCAPGSCAVPATKMSGRWMLWLASLAVALFAAFPFYSGPVAEFLLSHASASQPAAVEHATFAIDGIDSPEDARAVESKLKGVPGVRSVTVLFEGRRAEVDYDPQSATMSQIEKVIVDAGYRVRKG